MKLSEVKEILSKSSQDDWIVDDESGSFTYKEDLNLHIQRADFDSFRDFNEPWAKSHPDPDSRAIEYVVKYGNSFVEKHTLVAVDGFRATLPMPKSVNDLKVRASEVNFAKIVNIGDRVDEYLVRSNLEIGHDE